MGNRDRFVDFANDEVRYCPELDAWYRWCDRRWRKTRHEEICESANNVIKAISVEADGQQDGEAVRKHAKSSQSYNKREALIKFVKTTPQILVAAHDLDRDPWLLGVENGIVNLHTGKLLLAEKTEFITLSCGVQYDQSALAPRWISFIDEITCGDKELANMLQVAAGYSLTGSTKEQVFFFLFGGGRNGKTVFLNTLQKLVHNYARIVPA
jgi:putative DNA primase/helicase